MNKYKLYMIIGISTLVLSIGTTFAYYIWKSSTNAVVNLNICTPTITFAGGSTINGVDILPVLSKEDGTIKEIEVSKKGSCTKDVTMNLYLELTTFPTELSNSSFKYELYKNSSTTLITSGNLSNKEEGTNITLLSNQVLNTSKDTYTLYIYIDGNMDNPIEMAGKNFLFKLWGSGEGAVLKPTIAETIVNIYNSSTKTPVINNGTTYQYDTSHSLMKDIGDNIRYYGANPNNYIYFNCSNYSNQTGSTCEKWRIIGVFNGKVKIMRNTIIGSYSWDNKDVSTGAERDYGKNDWTTARLMKLLNPSDYYSIDSNDNGHEQSLYYNSQSGTCFSGKNNATKDCDFGSTGIKNDTTRNMIAEVTWNLGGWNTSAVYSNQIYNYEHGNTVFSGRPTTWKGKIALPYPSDYGYAVDLNKCINKQLNSYNDSACTANNWMNNIFTSYGWLLSHNSNYAYAVWDVYLSGNMNDDSSYTELGVAPTLYLSPSLSIESGEGTSDNPYKLSV